MPRVRIELTTFRLWDWRAAYCANEAERVVEAPQCEVTSTQRRASNLFVYPPSIDEGNRRRERVNSWRFERWPFVRANDEGLTLETSAIVSFTASITLINTQLILTSLSSAAPTQLPSSLKSWHYTVQRVASHTTRSEEWPVRAPRQIRKMRSHTSFIISSFTNRVLRLQFVRQISYHFMCACRYQFPQPL